MPPQASINDDHETMMCGSVLYDDDIDDHRDNNNGTPWLLGGEESTLEWECCHQQQQKQYCPHNTCMVLNGNTSPPRSRTRKHRSRSDSSYFSFLEQLWDPNTVVCGIDDFYSATFGACLFSSTNENPSSSLSVSSSDNTNINTNNLVDNTIDTSLTYSCRSQQSASTVPVRISNFMNMTTTTTTTGRRNTTTATTRRRHQFQDGFRLNYGEI